MSKKQETEKAFNLVQLGETIRKRRIEQGLTQSQLAKDVGVDESYISKIEKGRLSYTPSEETLRLLAQVLQTDPLDFLILAAKTPNELQSIVDSPSAREFFEIVRVEQLKSEDWQDITSVLRRRLAARGRKKH